MSGFLAGIVPFLIIISVIVTIHELGHYLVARAFGTRIDRFSVGFGSILLRRVDRHGTEWCVSALPLGGYVKFAGDDNISSMSPSTDELEAARAAITEREGAAAVGGYFHFKPLWQRFLIILAGPAANFVLAIFVFTMVNLAFGQMFIPPTVGEVLPGSGAQAAGFQVGDTITRVDGHAVDSFEDVHNLIILRADSTIPIVVARGAQSLTLTTSVGHGPVAGPTGNPVGTGGLLGVRFVDRELTRRFNPWTALVEGNKETWGVLDSTFTYVGRIFAGKENGDKVSGIVGMTKATGDITVAVAQAKVSVADKMSDLFQFYVQFIALVSVSIGFLNLLPIPALDGGHLAFYIWQSVTKKQVSAGFQAVSFRIAVVLILGLMIFAFWNDINQLGVIKLVKGVLS